MLTQEQLEKWAPDPGTRERAQALASSNKWRQLGSGAGLNWGLARTTGATRHRVLLNPGDATFFCSCPVRKKPCKHVLALAQLALADPEAFRSYRQLPEWVQENIDHLAPKPEETPEPSPPNPEALEQRRRNREKRLEQMFQGMDELERWLTDAIRQGLGRWEGQAQDLLERFAAKMVDAKLGGIARRVRSWKRLLERPQWQDDLLAEMADLYLLVSAFRQSDQLPDDLVQDLLQVAGFNMRKDEVMQGDPVTGAWLVMGLIEGEEDNLRFRRTWVQETGTGRFALLLDFSWGGQPFDQDWQPGQEFDGSLVYYPSAYPQRALVSDLHLKKIRDPLPQGTSSLQTFIEDYAAAVTQQPWLLRFPAFLQNMRPLRQNGGQWALADTHQRLLPLRCSETTAWMLLSLSGGLGLDLFGEWNGATFSPLSCLSSGKWIVFSLPE